MRAYGVNTRPCSLLACRRLVEDENSDVVIDIVRPAKARLWINDTDYRFCSLACFCLFVRSNYMESRSQGGAA